MNREQAKKILPIIQAYAKGKTIEQQDCYGNWIAIKDPEFHWAADTYRVKPESDYRPFKDTEECWTEMQKHQPFGWIKDEDGAKRLITDIFSLNEVYASESKMNFHDMLEEFTFADGTPFGMKEDGTKTE
nr:MAG TPA: hypothetical protein [Caudoviricetes sp.]